MNHSPDKAQFNLWTEPWITLVRSDGSTAEKSLETTLLAAQEYVAIYETSPLVVVGIHRLLVAVLQDIFDPQHEADLVDLWRDGRFRSQLIKDFGSTYASRFNLFDSEAPFMQSADLPADLEEIPKRRRKEVTNLAPEMPSATAVTHYQHGRAEDKMLCAPCSAKGLVLLPAFATSGGRGIKPSINGVPPIYVLPGGESLFEMLVASLLVPAYQPEVRSKAVDKPWWKREPFVGEGEEVTQVGYLESLTFPARRIRLYPKMLIGSCSRCGRSGGWGVQTIYFQMGNSRSKNAPFWFDPFVAYRLPGEKRKATDKPTPVRPVAGRALWREFASLLLHSQAGRTKQPTILEQLAELNMYYGLGKDDSPYPLRCVGIRTDMKAKIFEWVDSGFEMPPRLLRDPEAGDKVQSAIDFASECEQVINRVFRSSFAEASNRHNQSRIEMRQSYWSSLAGPFRQFVLEIARSEEPEYASEQWMDIVIREAESAFMEAAVALGDDAATLRQRVQGERYCRGSLRKVKENSAI